MKKVKTIKGYIKSGDRMLIILSSLLLCLFMSACGNEAVMYIEEEEYASDKSNVVMEVSLEENNENADSAFGEENNHEAEIKAISCVYVCGAVNDETVYIFEEGERVCDAIEAAGGFTENACRNAVNMSERLEDEQKIYVPTLDEVTDTSVYGEYGGTEVSDGRININTANVAELTTLKGIGETRAKAIIEYRESFGGFKSVEDIMNVSGIGPSSFQKIKDEIRIK